MHPLHPVWRLSTVRGKQLLHPLGRAAPNAQPDPLSTGGVCDGNAWSAAARGIPIIGNVFQAGKKLRGVDNVTVTSSFGAAAAGSLAGAVSGSTGNGVEMPYALNRGGNSVTNPAAVTV
jgi:hypothetical protein